MKTGHTGRKIALGVLATLALAWLAGLATASPASAQWRFGVTVGIPTGVGVVVDYRPWEHNGLELKIAGIPPAPDSVIRDASWLSVSLTAKQYWWSGDWESHVGAGLIIVGGEVRPGDDQPEISGWLPVPVVTVPVGLDWKPGRRHTIGLTGNMIAVGIPFPELSYRWGSSGDDNR